MSSERFMTLPDVADELNTSASQIYALVRTGDLVAIQIGGRGQWRIERVKLEEYIGRMYEQTARALESDVPPTTEGDGAWENATDPASALPS